MNTSDLSPIRHLRPEQTRHMGTLRVHGEVFDDFSSNDYLGYAWDERLIAAGQAAMARYGTGATGSRLLTGDQRLFHDLEDAVSAFKHKPAALVFNSGYQANLSILSTLFGAGDVIFADKLCHASLLDGIRLSDARCFRFFHNDMAHLARLLEKHRSTFKRALIVTESVFSMDGDEAPLWELVALKNRFGCELYVDEAHATGLCGPTGAGLSEALGLSEEIDYLMGTFGKALGSFGAYVGCSPAIKDTLINGCRGFVYTTALPPATIAVNLAALSLVRSEPERRQTLAQNTRRLRDGLESLGLSVLGDTQIVPVVIGDEDAALNASKQLQSHRFWILPIRYPTVAKNKARLRISVTASHSVEAIDRLIATWSLLQKDGTL